MEHLDDVVVVELPGDLRIAAVRSEPDEGRDLGVCRVDAGTVEVRDVSVAKGEVELGDGSVNGLVFGDDQSCVSRVRLCCGFGVPGVAVTPVEPGDVAADSEAETRPFQAGEVGEGIAEVSEGSRRERGRVGHRVRRSDQWSIGPRPGTPSRRADSAL